MRILHTESSNGWGGQEIRILSEAEGMRRRGHEVFFAVARGGGLVSKAREKGFVVYEITFKKRAALKTLPQLISILKKHDIDLVNTHSSLDSWMGAISARLCKVPVLRTRHLSTAIRKGLNSRLLYKTLSDYVVTTSSGVISAICEQSGLSPTLCRCIPTGVDPSALTVSDDEVRAFREKLGVKESDVLVGTACFVRSWKGIGDLLKAAELLKEEKQIKWVVVGGGYVERFEKLAQEMKLCEHVLFTGHLQPPFAAIRAMDIFALLSTAHEGISQASLQAAFLERPLLTTSIGGLPEVCLDGKTGLVVPPTSSQMVAEAVLKLSRDKKLRQEMGKNARQLVLDQFTFESTLNRMEEVYALIKSR